MQFISTIKAAGAAVKAFFSTPAFNKLRAVLYVGAPAALWQLVAEGHLSQDAARLWAAVAIAAASPALASIFAPSGFKTYLAQLGIPVQGVLVFLGGTTNEWYLLAAAVLGSIISSGLWASNVHNAAIDTASGS